MSAAALVPDDVAQQLRRIGPGFDLPAAQALYAPLLAVRGRGACGRRDADATLLSGPYDARLEGLSRGGGAVSDADQLR